MIPFTAALLALHLMVTSASPSNQSQENLATQNPNSPEAAVANTQQPANPPSNVKTVFPDISEHQPNVDFAELRKRTDAVSVRLNYGTRADKTMPDRIDQVRDNKFTAVMYYVFLRPSQLNTDQVSTVTKLLPELKPGESIFVDWESDLNGSTPGTDQLQDMLSKLDAHYKQPTGVYCSASIADQVGTDRPLWIAAYGPRPKTAHTFWQYTNKDPNLIPGLPVDGNTFDGSAAELAARNTSPNR